MKSGFFKGLKVHQIIANSFFYLLVVDVVGAVFTIKFYEKAESKYGRNYCHIIKAATFKITLGFTMRYDSYRD